MASISDHSRNSNPDFDPVEVLNRICLAKFKRRAMASAQPPEPMGYRMGFLFPTSPPLKVVIGPYPQSVPVQDAHGLSARALLGNSSVMAFFEAEPLSPIEDVEVQMLLLQPPPPKPLESNSAPSVPQPQQWTQIRNEEFTKQTTPIQPLPHHSPFAYISASAPSPSPSVLASTVSFALSTPVGNVPSVEELQTAVSFVALGAGENYIMRSHDIHLIAGAVREVEPHAQVYVTGSLAAGLAQTDSDVDLFVERSPTDTVSSDAPNFLKRLYSRLPSHLGLVFRQKRLHARVPIIRIVAQHTNTTADISCTSCDAVAKSLFLGLLGVTCPAFATCAHLIKRLALKNNLNDAASASFSSYSLYWLIVSALQTRGALPPLPFLEPLLKQFGVDAAEQGVRVAADTFLYQANLALTTSLRELPEPPTKHQEVGHHLRWVCWFYGNRLSDVAARPGPGGILPRSAVQEAQQATVYVQDPFDATHNCARAVSVDRARRLQSALSKAFHDIQAGKSIEEIFVFAAGEQQT